MSIPPIFGSILLVLIVSALLIFTGLKRQPGIGILGAVGIIAIALWLRREGLASLGLGAPPNWGTTLLLGLALGVAIQLFSVAFLEPWTEKLTGTAHDHSVVDSVKGSWRAFVQWMLVVWLFVALLEEGVYRGFLMTEVSRILGSSPGMLLINILLTSIVFGLSHGYQGRSGILSTGIIGAFLGGIFVLSGFNLWLAILTHGFIDTVGIGLIAIDGDRIIREKIWKSQSMSPNLPSAGTPIEAQKPGDEPPDET